MTKEDKYMNEMLQKFNGYKPSVEPDWDVFYQENEGRILVKQHKGIVTKSFFRISLAVVFIVTVFVGAYYYMQPTPTKEIDIRSDQSNIIPAGENEAIDGQKIENSAATMPDQNIEIIPQGVAPVNNSNAGGIKVPVENPGEILDQTPVPITQPETRQTIISEPIKTNVPDQKEIISNEPVIIKKTVIIKDTIRVKRPIKKEK